MGRDNARCVWGDAGWLHLQCDSWYRTSVGWVSRADRDGNTGALVAVAPGEREWILRCRSEDALDRCAYGRCWTDLAKGLCAVQLLGQAAGDVGAKPRPMARRKLRPERSS